MSAAEQLAGLDLDDGWKVAQRLTHASSSGGTFSVPYLVHDKDGKGHFLKAFDFSQAFDPGRDVIRILQSLTALYEHERNILDYFKTKRLSRVVTAVKHGYVRIPGMSALDGTVYYLIFELAEGDVRKQVDIEKRLDCLWSLRVLDDVTLGLWQAHRHAIANQDVKPSNVLLYKDDVARVSDFGRAARRGTPIWVDSLSVPGDQTYAPPELLYSWLHPDFMVRRIGADLYLLGNLAAFMFSGVNVTPSVIARLDPQFRPGNWAGTYEHVLPHIQRAFAEIVTALAPEIDPLVRNEAVSIIRELCNPDIARRGHPTGIGRGDQYSLERYKSRFDLMLKRASIAARVQKAATTGLQRSA
jgi:eukaryotic-like serine/threonine-protein kinase